MDTNEGRDAKDRLWGDFAVYLHESAMMSADLLRVSVSLTRKLQRTFCTSLAWRNPFPLTTTWKDSEADGGFQNKSPPTWFHRVCMFRIFTSFADAGGLDSQDLNAGSLQDLRVKIWNCSSGLHHIQRDEWKIHLHVFRTESMTLCRASKPSWTGKTCSLLSAMVESCRGTWRSRGL